MTCALALVACSSSSSAAPFTLPAGYTPGGVVPTCLLHQTAKPTPAYMGGAHNDLGVELPFLAYYTAVGAKPFCDSKKATADDKAWAQLYVTLSTSTGTPAADATSRVSTILG